MSKYIPGNQKHLTLENRIYIENELNKALPLRILPGSCARILPQSLKKSGLTVSQIGITKGLSIMLKTSAFTAITVRRLTPAERSSCAESNAHPVLPATKPAETLKKSIA